MALDAWVAIMWFSYCKCALLLSAGVLILPLPAWIYSFQDCVMKPRRKWAVQGKKEDYRLSLLHRLVSDDCLLMSRCARHPVEPFPMIHNDVTLCRFTRVLRRFEFLSILFTSIWLWEILHFWSYKFQPALDQYPQLCIPSRRLQGRENKSLYAPQILTICSQTSLQT